MRAEAHLAGPGGVLAAELDFAAPTAVDRRFARILGASLLIHVLVLLLAHGWRPPVTPALPTIMATLRLVVPPVSEAPAPAALQPQARQPEARPVQRSVPRAMTAAGPANVPAIPAMPEAPAVLPTAAAPVVVAPSVPAEAATRPALVDAAAASQRAQAELLAGYRRQLAELFARHQEYPRIAALRGWEGEVRVRLKVARKGSLLHVQLDQSSGFEVLDRHALAMLGELPGLPALPEALVPDEIQVVVPIHYKLKKAT